MSRLPASVDHDILERRIISALVAIRDATGCSIHEAIDVFAVRYDELRRDRPDDFAVGPDEYGRGFYS
ncbi:hypothetical protein [Streptomyces sp. SID13588]|uniref:hypothetical protein n=1 Tax=Streptomyces sp. SID13588 TaxID=2706051 RepID=UPI0013C6C6DB|nr:hypothetical protein [Streptomyces sp. SID13588]NEA76192.1 hypothetical protein [Streptomyces sp. SID13588]